jgi:phosphopantetheine adenylyltransferase
MEVDDSGGLAYDSDEVDEIVVGRRTEKAAQKSSAVRLRQSAHAKEESR